MNWPLVYLVFFGLMYGWGIVKNLATLEQGMPNTPDTVKYASAFAVLLIYLIYWWAIFNA